jgi:hypothetical protein
VRTHSGFVHFLGSIWLATLSTGISSFALAAGSVDCPIEEFRMDLDVPNLTIQDQDDLGICYASTAATMLQMIDPKHRPVSALDLSMHTNESKLSDKTPLVTKKEVTNAEGKVVTKYKGYNETGNTCSAILKAVEKGACPKELSVLENADLSVYDRAVEKLKGANPAPSSGTKKTTPNPFSSAPESNQGKPGKKNPFGSDQAQQVVNPVKLQATVLYQLGVLHDDLKRGKVSSANLSEYLKQKAPELLNQYRQNAKPGTLASLSFPSLYQNLNSCQNPSFKDLNQQITTLASAMEKISADQQFEEVLKRMAEPDLNLVLGAISPECLESKNRITYPSGLDCQPVTRPTTVKEFSQTILKSMITGMPVGVLLCSAFLKHPAPYTDPSAFKNCKDYDGDHHFVTVVGARKNSAGACEFLLQNSWGTDCGSHLKNCKDGRVWVDDLTLFRNASEVDVMSIKPNETPKNPVSQTKKVSPEKSKKQ